MEINNNEYFLLSFATREEAKRFIKYNDELLKNIFNV